MAVSVALCRGLLLLALAASACAQFGNLAENRTGFFLFYASGQIVIANPDLGRVFSVVRHSDATSTPFPNKCPGNPFKGDWVDVTYGPGKRSLLASAVYAEPPEQRSGAFSDGVFTLDAFSGHVPQFLPLDKPPSTATFVPIAGKMLLTSGGSGSATQSLHVLGADGVLQRDLTLPSAGPLGSYIGTTNLMPGQLLHHTNMGGQAFLTSGIAAGVYSLDLFNQNLHPTSLSPFNPGFISFADLGCPATSGAVYSRLMRQAFFLCADKAPTAISIKLSAGTPRKGVVQYDVAAGKVIGLLPYVGEKIYITPDENFLLVLSSAGKTIYMLQFNSTTRTLEKWNNLNFATGFTPLELAFAPKEPFYLAYVSYLDIDRVGILDFQRVLQCGIACNPANSDSFVQDQQQMGYQNPPGPDNGFQGIPEPNYKPSSTRAIGAGGGWVCQASNYERTVYCFSPLIGAPIKFSNISYTQHIRFVPGVLTNYSDPALQLKRIDPYFNCSHPADAPAPAEYVPGGDGWQDTASAPAGMHSFLTLLATIAATIATLLAVVL